MSDEFVEDFESKDIVANHLTIDHDNLKAWDLFCACTTQWRVIPLGGYQGLDYQNLKTVFEIEGVKQKKWRLLFSKIRLIEAGALQQLTKRKSKD